MSIVEKALSKLRKGEEFSAAKTPPNGATRRVVNEPAPVLPPVPRTRIAVEPRVAATIHLDAQRLREGGLSPPPEGDTRRLADEIRRLKWALLKRTIESPPPATAVRNALMISSALPGEGKSFTSFNLALSLATEGERRVWLVDADTARPQLSRVLGVAERPGLLDVIADSQKDLEDVLIGTDVPGLFVIPCGGERKNAPELIGSSRMAQLLAGVAARHEDVVVIFDTAPILATSVPQALAPIAAQIIIAVRADHTPRHAVTEALAQLHRKEGISLFLTQVSPLMRHDYYAGYYDYVNRA